MFDLRRIPEIDNPRDGYLVTDVLRAVEHSYLFKFNHEDKVDYMTMLTHRRAKYDADMLGILDEREEEST